MTYDTIASAPVQQSEKQRRSFYSSPITEFLSIKPAEIIGQLSKAQGSAFSGVDAEQLTAWEREIDILRLGLGRVGEPARSWSLILEMPLFRLGKRIDAVILAPGAVVPIEFKIGATAYEPHRLQAEGYAQCLRDFHETSQRLLVIPVLCAERAAAKALRLSFVDGVADLLLVNGETFTEALRLVADCAIPSAPPVNLREFEFSPYRPTPTIVEAAQALYAGHRIPDIGRGDASDLELQAAAEQLKATARDAECSKSKVICFVTGAPGAGKTLLGLDLALKSRGSDQPAALLSGNRPLVHVLTEALAADIAARGVRSKTDGKYEAAAAIQNLLGYLKEHTDGAVPPEHVIVFDEAQRAWDAEVGQELMGRPASEPELFLEILDRLEWACLVCLVGSGQEINRGEGGLPLWGEALARAAAAGRRWTVFAAPQALNGGADIAGNGLLTGSGAISLDAHVQLQFHLANAMRAFRNPLHTRWVASLLHGDLQAARSLAAAMKEPPAWITRDLEAAKRWLRKRRRAGKSVGLLTSSGAVRLVGDGIPPAPRSNELGPIGHWFLKPFTDFRSSGALEIPMSEFGCQGLELDFVSLCWGGDLIWSEAKWVPRMMRAPKWQVARDPEKQRFRINSYRVLLTRGRAGTIIFVPMGSPHDATRSPAEYDAIANALLFAGCANLSHNDRC